MRTDLEVVAKIVPVIVTSLLMGWLYDQTHDIDMRFVEWSVAVLGGLVSVASCQKLINDDEVSEEDEWARFLRKH